MKTVRDIVGSSFTEEIKHCTRDPNRRCERQALVPPCIDQMVRSSISASDQTQQIIRSSTRIGLTAIGYALMRIRG